MTSGVNHQLKWKKHIQNEVRYSNNKQQCQVSLYTETQRLREKQMGMPGNATDTCENQTAPTILSEQNE